MRIKGLLLAVEPPKNFAGTSKGGKAYSMWNRQMQVFTGKGNVVCTERRDHENEFGPLPIGTIVDFKMQGVRVHDGQVNFTVEV